MQTYLRLAATCVGLWFLPACFGDNDGSGSPQIVDVSVPASVDAEGGSATLVVRVRGRAEEQLSIALNGTLGSFDPSEKLVITDANGDASMMTSFTAGAVSGDEEAIANVSNFSGDRSSFRFAFPVTPINRVGQFTQLPSSEPASLGYLEGQAITVTDPGVLRRVGIVSTGAVDVVVGIYTESAGQPTTLLASTSATLKLGVNELPVPDTSLPAGTYWFMANYRTAVSLYVGTATRFTKFVSRTFATALPTTYPPHMTYTDNVRNYYFVLGR
jgi:hypothetical protein